MSKNKISLVWIGILLFSVTLQLYSGAILAAADEEIDLIAVIKSDAPHKEKADSLLDLYSGIGIAYEG